MQRSAPSLGRFVVGRRVIDRRRDLAIAKQRLSVGGCRVTVALDDTLASLTSKFLGCRDSGLSTVSWVSMLAGLLVLFLAARPQQVGMGSGFGHGAFNDQWVETRHQAAMEMGALPNGELPARHELE